MIANNSAKNIGATRANCTTAEPRRLRRNWPSNERNETVEAAGEGIGQSWAAATREDLPENDCRSVARLPSPRARTVKTALTLCDAAAAPFDAAAVANGVDREKR